MPSLSVLRTMCRELVTSEQSKRVIEPDLVMDDPDKVAAYTRAGREDGVMAPVYLFHCAQICDVIQANETVVDLGCGPATQLAMVARLNPDTQFIGVDLSPDMLQRAYEYIITQELENIELRTEDVTHLASISDHSVDAVISTVALHHLPDLTALDRTFREIQRVLKPGGGVYLVDFGHLKSEQSIKSFAYQYADRQAELFTLDYLYSLRAAFSLNDFQQVTHKHLRDLASVYSTFLIPYMVAVKSRHRSLSPDKMLMRKLHTMRDQLPPHHKRDLADLRIFFRLGGLHSSLLG